MKPNLLPDSGSNISGHPLQAATIERIYVSYCGLTPAEASQASRNVVKKCETSAVRLQAQSETCAVAILPSWLPNETIHSLACRYHLLASYEDPTITARQLFGHAGAGSNPLFVTGLNQLSSVSGEALGTSKSMLLEHSSIPFFISLLKPARRERFLSGFGHSGWKYWKIMLRGFYWPDWSSRVRYCALCLEHDNAKYGVGYWHSEHTLPAAQICLLHDCLLTTPKLIDRWSLPTTDARSSKRIDLKFPSATAKSLLRKATQICNVMAATSPNLSNPATICDVFSFALREFHVTGGPLNLQFHEEVARLFQAHYAPIGNIDASVDQGLNIDELKIAIYRVFSAGASYNPHIFCLLIAWLFESWESFYHQYRQHSSAPPAQRKGANRLHSLDLEEPPFTSQQLRDF